MAAAFQMLMDQPKLSLGTPSGPRWTCLPLVKNGPITDSYLSQKFSITQHVHIWKCSERTSLGQYLT